MVVGSDIVCQKFIFPFGIEMTPEPIDGMSERKRFNFESVFTFVGRYLVR